jgi:hypothetical protein
MLFLIISQCNVDDFNVSKADSNTNYQSHMLRQIRPAILQT